MQEICVEHLLCVPVKTVGVTVTEQSRSGASVPLKSSHAPPRETQTRTWKSIRERDQGGENESGVMRWKDARMVLARVAQEGLRGREAAEDLCPGPEGVTEAGEAGRGGRAKALSRECAWPVQGAA